MRLHPVHGGLKIPSCSMLISLLRFYILAMCMMIYVMVYVMMYGVVCIMTYGVCIVDMSLDG